MNRLTIFQQIIPQTSKPFRLIELLYTTDGNRSRICSGHWATLKEAEEEIERRRQHFYEGCK